jgi:membrane-anchored protein YejM (alkaline phosphatase superfamily)
MIEQKRQNNKKVITPYTIIAFFSFAYIYSRYMAGLNTSGLTRTFSLYITCSFWLHFFTIASLAVLFVLVFETILARRTILWTVFVAVTASLLTIYLYVDSKLYNTINLHINGFLIESLLQENALDQVGITPQQIVQWFWPIVVFLTVHIFISPLSKYGIASISLSKKNIAVFFIVLAVIVGIDKLLFSYFYFKGKPFVFQLKETPPVYLTPHPYHIDKILSFLLGENPKVSFIEPLDGMVIAAEAEKLNYPGALQTNDIELRREFNIVMVAAESLRKHDVDSKTAPFYTRLSKEAIEARNHYTSGNTTHFGLFSLFYGLNPFYFHDFRLSLIPPIGITLLKDNGYEIYATAAKTMHWYDQDKFLLGSNPGIYIPENGKNYERDRLVTDRSIDIARRHEESGKPYFNFIYYYTTHADYEHPDSHSLFKPEIKGKIDYSDQALRIEDRSKLVNRYRNAIHYVDSELERLVDGIKRIGAWGNTILIFTSDHGEEFFEENAFGHNSNLNEYQTKVPFLMHIPGNGNVALDKQTSHTDVMQTILGEIFSAAVEKIQFQGRNMLSGETGAVYVAKAHYQRPTAYAIHVKGQKAVVNVDGGFMEIESITGEHESDQKLSSKLHKGIAGLINQIKELKN